MRVDDDCKHFRVRCKPRQVSNERRSNTTGMDPIAIASNVALRVKQSPIGCSENVARSMSDVRSEMLNLTFFFVAVMLANSHSNGVVAPGTALPRRRVAGLRAGNQARIRGLRYLAEGVVRGPHMHAASRSRGLPKAATMGNSFLCAPDHPLKIDGLLVDEGPAGPLRSWGCSYEFVSARPRSRSILILFEVSGPCGTAKSESYSETQTISYSYRVGW